MRGIFSITVVLACSSPHSDRADKADERHNDRQDGRQASETRVDRGPGRYAIPDSPPNPTVVDPLISPTPQKRQPLTPPRPTNCVATDGAVTSIQQKGTKLRACIDTDQDTEPDQCVVWDRTGKLLQVEPVFDVEDSDVKTATAEVLDPDAEDPRIKEDGNSIEACPEDRICMRFMPALRDGDTIDSVRADVKHRAVALAISDPDSKNAHTEVWDLLTGRLRTRTKFAGLETDVEYSYSMRSYGDAFLQIAKRNDTSDAVLTLLGLDGSRRATLAGGSRFASPDKMLEIAPGQLAVLDLAPPDKPYIIYVHNLASGATVARFVVTTEGDSDSNVSLAKIDHTSLGVVQWSSNLRIDVLDVRTSTARSFTVPGC